VELVLRAQTVTPIAIVMKTVFVADQTAFAEDLVLGAILVLHVEAPFVMECVVVLVSITNHVMEKPIVQLDIAQVAVVLMGTTVSLVMIPGILQ